MSLHLKKLNSVLLNENSASLTTLTSAIINAKNGVFDLLKILRGESNNSIAKKAAPLIFQFPMLVTDGISTKSLTMVSKALEKQYAIFVRLASGLETATSVKNADDVKALLTKLHINMEDIALEDIKWSIKDISLVNSRLLNEASPFYESKSVDEIFEYGAKYNFKQPITREHESFISEDEKIGLGAKLADSDVKKANNVEPTLMEITLLISGTDGQKEFATIKVVIGVKTVAHLVRSNEIVENMVSSIIEKRFLFKLIRLTTGEISFIKDFFLNLEKNKSEAIDTVKNKKSPWWRALKNRASSSRIRNIIKIFKQLPPNATLVLSIEEAELLKNKFDIDIFGKDKIKLYDIMQEYFLMSVVVVNEAAELVHFFFDGRGDWEMHAFSEFKKETKDSELQKLLSVMVGRV